VFTAYAAPISGTVEITNSRDAAVRKHKDYTGVVVWLETADRAPSSPPTPKRVQMIQRDKRFNPHVIAVPVGSTVAFPNFDPIFHNAFSSFSGQPFDVGLYPPGTSRSVTFRRDGVVRVFCNIHQTMSAIIVVVKTPWYAVTNAQGGYQIAGVPPGDYRLRVFYERAPAGGPFPSREWWRRALRGFLFDSLVITRSVEGARSRTSSPKTPPSGRD